MDEYIKREDAINVVQNYMDKKMIKSPKQEQRLFRMRIDLRVRLRNIPAADVRENVRGEWIFEKGDGMTRVDGWCCTNCKHGFHTNVPYFSDYKFCPNCGVAMRGDNND